MSAHSFQVTFDCADVQRLATFWAVALNYELEPPPSGHDSWESWATERGIPRDQWRSALVDPAGRGPRLFFQPVPENKVAKNRVHLDVNVTTRGASAADNLTAVDDHVSRCAAAGGQVLNRFDAPGETYTVMTDPEGNEFCVQ